MKLYNRYDMELGENSKKELSENLNIELSETKSWS